MAIPNINYNLLYSAATGIRDQADQIAKLGLNGQQVAELITVIEHARQGNTTAFETSPDLVAQAYRVLEASSSFSSHPDSVLTLNALRPVASQSTWARRAAGSSGIFGSLIVFTPGTRKPQGSMPVIPPQGLVSTPEQQSAQLATLLQNRVFAEEMATWLDGAYYRGQGQTPPAFQAQAVEKLVHENIAMNLAGFYAVESGIGYLAEQTGQTPAQILQKIVAGTLPEADMLLLARFANATWKAGQPFRDLGRIGRANFVPATLLGATELSKDFAQLKAVAELLLPRVAHTGDVAQQRETLKTLLQSQEFAVEMATWLDGAYYRGQGQVPPAFDAKPVSKSVHENIAMNLAGFYAVEAGVGVLAERTGQTPLEILRQISTGSLPREDMLLLARFANATWKAGQPFRDLGRIARANFVPAVLLSTAELEKDFVQIRAAAEKMLYAVALGHAPTSAVPEKLSEIARMNPASVVEQQRHFETREELREYLETKFGRRVSQSELETMTLENLKLFVAFSEAEIESLIRLLDPKSDANSGGRAGSPDKDVNKPKKPRGPRGR